MLSPSITADSEHSPNPETTIAFVSRDFGYPQTQAFLFVLNAARPGSLSTSEIPKERQPGTGHRQCI